LWCAFVFLFYCYSLFYLYAVQLLFSSPVVSSDSFLVFILDWFKTAQFHHSASVSSLFLQCLVWCSLLLLHSGSFLFSFRCFLDMLAKLISIIFGFSHHTEYHRSFIIIRIITIVVVVCVFLWLLPFLTVISAEILSLPYVYSPLRALSYLHNISSSSSSSSSSLHCFGGCRISFPFLDWVPGSLHSLGVVFLGS